MDDTLYQNMILHSAYNTPRLSVESVSDTKRSIRFGDGRGTVAFATCQRSDSVDRLRDDDGLVIDHIGVKDLSSLNGYKILPKGDFV